MNDREQLIAKKKQIVKRLMYLEEELKNSSFVSSVDFSSMYPSIIRLLNASIENLVGFLNDDPVAYRRLGMSSIIKDYETKSKEIVKTKIANSKYVEFVGYDPRVALRLDIYDGKFDDATLEEITETPFEQFFLARFGIFDPDEVTMKFQGETYTITELWTLFKEKNYAVSGSGAVYKKDTQGLIPAYLEFLFFERKKVKKEMLHHFHNVQVLKKFKEAVTKDGVYKGEKND